MGVAPPYQKGYQARPEGAVALPSADEELRRMEWDKSEKIVEEAPPKPVGAEIVTPVPPKNERPREVPVSELRLSERTKGVLRRYQIKTALQLRQRLAEGTIAGFKGVGPGTITSIHKALNDAGFSTTGIAVMQPKNATTAPAFEPLPKKTQPRVIAAEDEIRWRCAEGDNGITEQQVIRLIMDRAKAGVFNGRAKNGTLAPDADQILRHLRKAMEFMGKELPRR